jgi:thioredoxin-related protein
MNNRNKFQLPIVFISGVALGVTLYHFWLLMHGMVVQPRIEVDTQKAMITKLQYDNQQLFDELLKTSNSEAVIIRDEKLPYDEKADARRVVDEARAQALGQNKFLMVVFGANWCMDCRNLHRMLKSKDVQEYSKDRFLFTNVNIGKFNENLDLANELGVSLEKGIPVAIIFDTNGKVIGTTNEGQLEPARRYSSKQILKFVRDVAQRAQIAAPDSVQ